MTIVCGTCGIEHKQYRVVGLSHDDITKLYFAGLREDYRKKTP